MTAKDNFPSSTLTPLSKKSYEEVLTAHNISALLLIRAYFDKQEESDTYSIPQRIGFCKLIQYLLQSPDFSFSEFLAEISDPKYHPNAAVLNRFQSSVHKVVNSDVDRMLTDITDCSRFLHTEPPPAISVHRLCPIGVFFRKMIVFLDKLTFPQTVKVYRLYQQYYLMWKKDIRDEESMTSEENKISCSMEQDTKSQVTSDDKSLSSQMNITEVDSVPCNIEVSVFTQNPFTNPIVSLFGISNTPSNDDKFVECLSWSNQQTELFLAQQATFLEFDEGSALPPQELHRILSRIITINPDYPETYFVSYLNCLRVKEFNGALENLIKFFDCVSYTDKMKSYRYAALNLAIFDVKFDNRDGALAALRECIMLAHQANDNVCLHFAQSWLKRLDEDKDLDSIESTALKCDELELHQIASLSLQMCAQKILMMGLDGSAVFNLLDKGDSINSQRILPDLTLTNLAHRAAVWCTYGQYNITFLLSQILLNIDTSFAVYGLKTYNTEDVCISLCNVANFLANVGNYQMAKLVLYHAKERFTHQFSERWKLCELILYFEYSLRRCLWTDAHEAAVRIAAIDKRESMLRLAELSYEKGDRVEAASLVDDVIILIGNSSAESGNYSPYFLLRAYLLGAKVKSSGSSYFMLQKGLTYAIRYGYPRFRALVQLELAKLQLELGFVKQAIRLIMKSSIVVFSENRFDEQATALALLAKCEVASVGQCDASSGERVDVIRGAIDKLEMARTLYQRLDIHSKVKDVVYLQTILSHEIDASETRNTYALEFRKLDVEQNHSYSCTTEFHCSL